MSMEIKETAMPTLTLDPFEEAEKAQIAETAEIIEIKEDDTLTAEEKALVAEFAEKIDLSNSGQILQYGAGTQKKMASFSESALENIKSKDLGEVGKLLSDVVVELKGFDANEEKGGFLGVFKKGRKRIEMLRSRYKDVAENIDNICKLLDSHQMQLMKDIAVMDKMYEANLSYFKELTMYIAAGKQKLEDTRNNELRQLLDRADRTGRAEDVQAAKDLESMCSRFEKKIYDLELTRAISIQTAPQIRMVQNNDTLMVEKIQSTVANTIPLWKSQMVMALGIAHSQEAIKAQREVSDMTNQLLKKNAETLKMATVDIAKETERGIVDIETLQNTNRTLIGTLDEVMQIQETGRQKRAEAETELLRMENELKEKMLEVIR